jgi:aerobic-type carbon monoxide dehydrogenase small subunit (CoxS/CutS family)
VIVNGREAAAAPEPNELLLDYLRERLGLTGAKRSCDVQVCGTCTVLVDGAPVSACCTLAADAAGREVLTVEGFAELADFARYEDAFTRHAAVQCGFCTSGMLLTIKALVDAGEPLGSDEEVKRALAGNLCRCTGYKGIVEAVRDLAGGVPAPSSSLLETD